MRVWVLALLLLPFASAAPFDDWVAAGTTVAIDGVPFTVTYSERQSVAVLNSSLGRWVLEQGECKESGAYRYCFAAFDDTGRVQYRDGIEYPALQIRVEKLAPAVRVSRTISASKIDLGKRADITVTLENTGDKPALNAVFEDRFPEGIAVVSASGAQRYPQMVRWEGVLSPKKSISLKYTIEARNFVEDEVRAVLRYFDGEVRQQIESDSLEITVTLPFTIEQDFSPEDITLNQEVVYKVKIENDINRPLQVDAFTVTIPSGMQVIRPSPNWKPDPQKRHYTFSGAITDSENFELRFRIPQKGIYDLASVLTVTSEGKTFTKQLVKPLRIGVSQLVPHVELDPPTVQSRGAYRLTASLENVGSESIRLGTATLSSTVPRFTGVTLTNRNIRQHDTEEVFDKRLFAPSITRNTQYRLTLAGSYTDARNATLTFSESTTLTVEALPEVILLEAIPDQLRMPRSGTLQVKVFIANTGAAPLKHVEVADLIPKGINVVSGTPSATLDLAAGERKLAYAYAVKLLESYKEQDVLSMKTTANVEVGKTLYTADAQTTVLFGEASPNPEFAAAEQLAPTTDVGESTEQDAGELPLGSPRTVALPKTEQQQGLLSRIWQWVRNLFGGDADGNEG